MDAATLLDPRFTALDPAPVEIPAVIRDGRAAIHAMGETLRAIPESDLARPWSWSGESEEEVRTGAYVALAAIHEGEGEVERLLRAAELAPGPAGGALAAVVRARWELHGILASIDEDTYDGEPGGGEWSIRETVGHIVEAQRSYPWFSAWWLARRDESLADAADESHGDPLPSEGDEASGSPATVLQRLDALVDLSVRLWSPSDEAALAVRARWSGFPVTLGFRTHRWSAHLEEHTLQVEKTLAMLGTPIPESARLHRLLCRAWGDLEALILALPPDAAVQAASEGIAGGAIRVATESALELVRDAAGAAGAAG